MDESQRIADIVRWIGARGNLEIGYYHGSRKWRGSVMQTQIDEIFEADCATLIDCLATLQAMMQSRGVPDPVAEVT